MKGAAAISYHQHEWAKGPGHVENSWSDSVLTAECTETHVGGLVVGDQQPPPTPIHFFWNFNRRQKTSRKYCFPWSTMQLRPQTCIQFAPTRRPQHRLLEALFVSSSYRPAHLSAVHNGATNCHKTGYSLTSLPAAISMFDEECRVRLSADAFG